MTFVLNNQGTKILQLQEIATNFDFGYRYLKSIKNFRNVSKINVDFYIPLFSYRVEFLQCLKY